MYVYTNSSDWCTVYTLHADKSDSRSTSSNQCTPTDLLTATVPECVSEYTELIDPAHKHVKGLIDPVHKMYPAVLFNALILLVNTLYTTIYAYAPLP